MHTVRKLAILSLGLAATLGAGASAQQPAPQDAPAGVARMGPCPMVAGQGAQMPGMGPGMGPGGMGRGGMGPGAMANMPPEAMHDMQQMHAEMAALREEMRLLREELGRR